ncbi:hypothetical protein N8I77_013376 [Diaporthe amygdali]|uniref:Ribosomal RNA methyltransferase FtsJ domain-containing protein n=1 Tax=Phomopsis amygdali TaxID=1214568 RepID=A0AAD9S2D1_PHOAM|nr:hypothetical protein N8I77_013376 [Diaporthe amygdali]
MQEPRPGPMNTVEDVVQEDATEGCQTDVPANARIKDYLMERVPEFVALCAIRDEGWKNPAGDRFFKAQQKQADRGSQKTQIFLDKMMRNIAKEMQEATRAFSISGTTKGAEKGRQKRILDCCMAPGTYLQAALKHNPDAHALAFTLPPEEGGHTPLLERDESRGLDIRLLDLTMLAADMGVTPDQIPKDHPDATAFLPRQVEDGRDFDLVICDGQVLRTHEPRRAAYREPREARRLGLTQLVLGLDHLRPGATMIILLHKVETWGNVRLLHTFSRFSHVQLFKPSSGHAKRSSFYMVATDIRSEHPLAEKAVNEWKDEWKQATFASDEEFWEVASQKCSQGRRDVDLVLKEFGPELVRLGRNVWKIQADALKKAPFNRRL